MAGICSLLALTTQGLLGPNAAARLGRVGRAVARPVASSPLLDRRHASSIASAAVFGAALSGLPGSSAAADPAPVRLAIETTAGTMEFDMWPEVAPKTVDNFVKLANQGYFDGQCFHRVISGFVIQGGDPNSKKGYGPDGTLDVADAGAIRAWGRGGPGYNIQ
ncbi:cyclophilin-like domain-containing protein, partial [Pavlovales sp. CCMP2436]